MSRSGGLKGKATDVSRRFTDCLPGHAPDMTRSWPVSCFQVSGFSAAQGSLSAVLRAGRICARRTRHVGRQSWHERFWRATFLAAVSGCRGALVGVAVFSALINILYLTGSFYMLQVYDRVIPSRSIPTLIALSVLAATLYAGQAALDFFRGRLLLRMGRSLDERLSPRCSP